LTTNPSFTDFAVESGLRAETYGNKKKLLKQILSLFKLKNSVICRTIITAKGAKSWLEKKSQKGDQRIIFEILPQVLKGFLLIYQNDITILYIKFFI
jgi:hypothetical protein